jgi:aminotransferase EvaB
MANKIRFVNPQRQYAEHREELLGAIDDVLTRGALVTQKERGEFESKFAAFCGAEYGIGVNSGTSALDIGLQAAGIGAGDEVITVAHTFIASISTICLTGAQAVLIDVGDDFDMDVSQIEKALTPKTKAILPVQFNGRLCDMEVIMDIAKRKGLVVIEDAAQSLGATMKMSDGSVKMAGTFGLVGAFSLYWAKTLGAPGTGGIAITDDADIAKKLQLMCYNGEDRDARVFRYHAHNFYMDSIRAVFLSAKMKYLPQWLARRREIAEMYRKGLGDMSQLKLPHFDDPRRVDSYNNYVIQAERRNELVEYLSKNELVETLVQWEHPTYTEPVMKDTKGTAWRFGNGLDLLPKTEEISTRVVSLPMYPELTNEEIGAVIDGVKGFYSQR